LRKIAGAMAVHESFKPAARDNIVAWPPDDFTAKLKLGHLYPRFSDKVGHTDRGVTIAPESSRL
jgi:hypothetical protein